MREMWHLGDEERAAVVETLSAIHNGLVATVRQFVSDETQARHIAWLMVCIGVGYQQLFAEPAFQGQVDLSMQDLMTTLGALMA